MESKPKLNKHAEAAQMLSEARLHLEKVGWIKGTFKSSAGVCLLQALQDVDGTKHGADVDAEVKRVILKHVPVNIKSIPTFNDHAATTKKDVFILLRACEQIELELAIAES
jgi:hypothetical protein